MSRVKSLMVASIAAMMGAMAHVIQPVDPMSKTPKRRPPAPRPYLGQTDEQRAWNQAVDARKAAKNSGQFVNVSSARTGMSVIPTANQSTNALDSI